MKIGVALSGGGIKGAAHIGVLQAFKENKINIDMISGASSGSIVATLYAAGFSPGEIYKFFKKYAKDIKYVDASNIIKLIFGILTGSGITINGLTKGKSLENNIRKECAKKDIQSIKDIKFPLYISSVNLGSGNTYIFNNQKSKIYKKFELIDNIDIATAVRASCSYPGVFTPVKWNGCTFVDGEIRENTPWEVLKIEGADKTICVTFKDTTKKSCCKNLINVIDCSIGYLNSELKDYELIGSGETIEIKTSDISLLEYSKVDELYQIGYKTANEFCKKNKNLLQER